MDYAVYKVKSDSLVLALIMEAKYRGRDSGESPG